MADITFLASYNNKSTGLNQLLAGWGGDIFRFNASTQLWISLGQPTSSTTRTRMRTFLDRGFWVNGTNNNRRWNGTSWTDEITTKKAPLAKYIHVDPNQARFYLANLSFNGQTFESRVWYPDFPKNNDITYGLEYGTDLVQYDHSAIVRSNGAYFKTRNIKIGDPFLILTGANAGEYKVQSIDSETQITLTATLTTTATNSTFWVGGNWFDVSTNNNDSLTGIGDNSSQTLFFKNESLHSYNGSSLRKIKGVPGTHSQESVVNIKEHTYYFHRTGIWRYNGVTSELISRPIQDYIDGISSSNYSIIVAWKVDETYRVFVGNVTNTAKGISVTNCILDFDTITETWSPGNLPVNVTASALYLDANTETIYLGTNSDSVYQDNIGTDDNGVAIPWMMETGWHFPGGPQSEIEFTRIQIHNSGGRGINLRYKLYGTPEDIDKQWKGLNDIEDEITEIKFSGRRDIDTIGRGINLQLSESSTVASPIIERIDIFWKPSYGRNL